MATQLPGSPARWQMLEPLRRLRYKLGETVRGLTLASAIRSIRSGSCSDEQVSKLLRGWHNEGFAADVAYLVAVAEYAAQAKGDILECGSGASTLLLAAIAERSGVKVHSLEHMPEWRQKVCAALEKRSLKADVHAAPLETRGQFSWYRIPENLPFHFAIVVCDGPPDATPGGRYGLLPCVGDRLQGAVVLMDDAERPGEQHVLQRWRTEFGVHFDIVTNKGSYAVATCPVGSQTETIPKRSSS